MGFLEFQFLLIASCLVSGYHHEDSGSTFFTPSHLKVLMYTNKIFPCSPANLLFSRLKCPTLSVSPLWFFFRNLSLLKLNSLDIYFHLRTFLKLSTYLNWSWNTQQQKKTLQKISLVTYTTLFSGTKPNSERIEKMLSISDCLQTQSLYLSSGQILHCRLYDPETSKKHFPYEQLFPIV